MYEQIRDCLEDVSTGVLKVLVKDFITFQSCTLTSSVNAPFSGKS